jgi:hypothetical protein
MDIENIFGLMILLVIAYFAIGLAIAYWGWRALWQIPKYIGLCLIAWTITSLMQGAIWSLPFGLGQLYWLLIKTPQMQ